MMTTILYGLAAGTGSIFLAFYFYVKFTRGVCNSKTDLSGKTAIVTGANTGIGYYTALDFATRNARVILAGRNKQKNETAAAAIRNETGNPNVVAMKLDVSLMKDVRRFADEFQKNENRLDILVNNAGVAGLEFMRTEEGLEMTMATNHLGHFLLTNLLLDKLKKCAPSRVVNVSSMAHRMADLRLDNLNSQKEYVKKKIYGDTKLCNVLFTRELARRFGDSGVTSYSLHPGVVATEIWRNLKFPLNWIIQSSSLIWFKSSEEGAATTIYCAVAEGIEEHSGSYFSDCKPANCSQAAKDDGVAKKLWEVSEQLTGMTDQKD